MNNEAEPNPWDELMRAAFANDEPVLPAEITQLQTPLDDDLLSADGAATTGRQVGRYRIDGEIARGGGGVVMRGRDLEIGREVAIKVLADGHSDSQALQRFVAEAQLAGRLQHPGMVPVHELGLDRSGRPFFVMKLVRGRTLAALLRGADGGARDIDALLATFAQLCEAVAYAHQRDVVHRDLKPANVMVGAFGEVQVMDWGMARHGDGQDLLSAEDLPGEVRGTPAYMPPEQARSQPTDRRSDVFSLGAILCEVLTGEPPYGLDEATTVAIAAQCDLGNALRRLAACGAAPELIVLARTCLEVEPALRPADAGEVAARLAEHRASRERLLREAELRAAAADARASAEQRSRRLQLLLLTSIALLALVIGGAFWLHQNRAQQARDEVDAAISSLIGEADAFARDGQWAAMQAALDRATRRTAAGASEHTMARLNQESARLRRSHDEARKEATATSRRRELEHRLTRLLTPRADLPLDDTDNLDTVLADFGVEINHRPPAESATRIAATTPRLREWLVRALDHRATQRVPEHVRQRLLAVAQLADTSSGANERQHLREEVAAGNANALVTIATGTAHDFDEASLDLLGASLAQLGRREVAIEVLRAGCMRFPGSFWLNVRLASLLAGVQDRSVRDVPVAARNEAVGHARISRALQPDSAFAHQFLATVMQRTGDPEGAFAELTRAASRFPNVTSLRVDLANVAIELRHIDSAVDNVKQVLEREPASRRGRHLRHRLRTLGHWPLPTNTAAERLRLQRAVAQSPERPELQLELAHVALAMADFEAALAATEAANEPSSTESARIAAQALLHLGRYDEAHAAMERAGRRSAFALRAIEKELSSYRRVATATTTYLTNGTLPADPRQHGVIAIACVHRGHVEAAAAALLQIGDGAELLRTLSGRHELHRHAACALIAAAHRNTTGVATRAIALTLLRHAIDRTEAAIARDSTHAPVLQSELRHWVDDLRLAAVRDTDSNAQLTDDERVEWAAAWAAARTQLAH